MDTELLKNQKTLAGILLTEVSIGMCRRVYDQNTHEILVENEERLAEDFLEARQEHARKGALLTHFCISAYERIIEDLLSWNIVKPKTAQVFVMNLDAEEIPTLVNDTRTFSDELFIASVTAFLNFEFQPGWHDGAFKFSLSEQFKSARLLEEIEGELHWTYEMQEIFGKALGNPWDPELLFARICQH